jgi:non-ribosomal peptide synthetase component F
MESMVGVFINTLPVRATIEAAASLHRWLTEMQDRQARVREFEYSPLSDVQKWSDVPRGRALFESILVFENMVDVLRLDSGGIEIEDVRAVDTSHYPVTLAVLRDPGLILRITYDARRFDAGEPRWMLARLSALLSAIVESPETATIGDVLKRATPEPGGEPSKGMGEKSRQLLKKAARRKSKGPNEEGSL